MLGRDREDLERNKTISMLAYLIMFALSIILFATGIVKEKETTIFTAFLFLIISLIYFVESKIIESRLRQEDIVEGLLDIKDDISSIERRLKELNKKLEKKNGRRTKKKNK